MKETFGSTVTAPAVYRAVNAARKRAFVALMFIQALAAKGYHRQTASINELPEEASSAYTKDC